jgi:hypothetical protein
VSTTLWQKSTYGNQAARCGPRVYRVSRPGNPVPVTVKDDLLEDFPHVYPGLTRPEIQRLLTLLDESASTEGGLSLSIATAIKPLAPEVAERIESYGQSDVDEYVRMLRGAAVLLLQKWQPEDRLPNPDSMASLVDSVEAED